MEKNVIFVNRKSGEIVPEGYPNSEEFVRAENVVKAVCLECVMAGNCIENSPKTCKVVQAIMKYARKPLPF